MEKRALVELAQNKAKQHGVDPDLLLAIIAVESSWNPWSIRFEPKYQYFYFYNEHASQNHIDPFYEKSLQATSWGLCQVMGGVCRELGYHGMLTNVLQPDVSVQMGCLKIKELMVRYGGEAESQIISAYNAGSARKLNGLYVNQKYVDKVHQELIVLRKLN